MKIQFSTPLTLCHVFAVFGLGSIVFAIGWFNVHLQQLLGEAEESIVRSRGLNVTHTSILFYCDLPYDACRCLVLSNRSENSENCITDRVLVGSRVLPLVSFSLQTYLVRELFSLSVDCPRIVIYALWIACLLTFVGMTISIYWNSCYHAYITLIMGWMSISLCFLSFHNLVSNLDRIQSSSHGNKIVPVHRSKRNHNASIAWKELP